MKILIVGGVAGGATVAARLRRLDEQAEVILFERGKYVSYANCGLPYYIGGTIADRSKLFVQTAKGFTDRFRIDIRTEQEVTSIDRTRKQVSVHNLATGETYTESYDRLVLSPGAEPLRPKIEASRARKSSRCAASPTRMPSNNMSIRSDRSMPWSWAADSSVWRWPRTCTVSGCMSMWWRWPTR